MNIYKLMQLENGNVELSHMSCYYPHEFEKKINSIAGENITIIKESTISFAPGLIQSFCIKKENLDLFIKKVLPNVGFKFENGYNLIWDKDEVCHEI